MSQRTLAFSALTLFMMVFSPSGWAKNEPIIVAQWVRHQLELRVIAPDGEHLSGPASAEIVLCEEAIDMSMAGSMLEDGIILRLKAHGPHKLEGQLSVGVCADSGNICRLVDLPFSGSLLGKKGELLLAAPPPKAKATDAVHKAADVLAAFERAKLSEKPVLLDFSTVWCPPCQTLAAEVLHDPQDADLLSQFEVVVLDADAANSFEWKDRYGVTGYPTLIVANPAGELVGRLMGFDEEQETLDWLAAMAGVTSTVSALLGNLDGVSEAALGSSARRLMDEGHDEAAKTLIARIPDEGDRALLSFRLAPSHDLLPILVAQKSPEIMEWIWAVVYELFQQEDIPESSRSLVRQAIVEGLNHVPPEQAAELAYVLADITPDNEHPERIFALGAALYRTAFSGDPVSDRGRTSFLVDLLYRAGNVEGALEVVDAAIVHFPEEFSYHNKRAGVLHDEARLDEALLSAVLATKFAKGDTILRAGMKQAEILAELDRKGEASQVLKSVLDTAIRPKDGQKVRTWRYIELAEAQLKTLGN